MWKEPQRSLFAEPFCSPKARKGRGKRGEFHVAGIARRPWLCMECAVLLRLERIQGQVDGWWTAWARSGSIVLDPESGFANDSSCLL